MDPTEIARFEEADKRTHPVESQWHYPIMMKYRFVALTAEQTGFVRKYTYRHESGVEVTCVTGSSSDYWTHGAKQGYWSDLEPHLISLGL